MFKKAPGLWIGAALCGLLLLFVPTSDAQSDPAGPWWNAAWPYRIPVHVSGSGIAAANIDFGSELQHLGLNQGLLDVRSIRVVPVDNGNPGSPLPYAESYATMLANADNPTIGWSGSGVYWRVNDGTAVADSTRFSQGNGSLKATIENLPGGYGYPGLELLIASGEPLTDWRPYETLVYDVWPSVNASARDQAPDLYWFKLYNACGGSPVTQGGPPLALNQWNGATVSLHPLDDCWPGDGLNLADITRMEFHTRDNATVSGNSGLWDDGDTLTLWMDNVRLVDQDIGAVRWQTVPGVDTYHIYFDTINHQGHPPPTLDETLGPATRSATPEAAAAGGYYHQIQNASVSSGMEIWAAPTTEKVLRTMTGPTAVSPLQISAARGEFEAFQLVVKKSAAGSLVVTASDFSNGTSVLPAPTLHRVDYVNVTTTGDHFDRPGPWPDPLWPLDNGDSVTFPAAANQPLWFTVQVPWDAPAGTYQGTVTIGSSAIPVTLTVWDFALPRTIHLPSEWGFSWSSIVDIYRGTINGSVQSCYWDVVDAFKQDFIDHRLIPKGVAWPAGLNYPGGIEYDCNGHLQPDAWGAWDFATLGGKYILGQQGFNGGYGFPTFLSHGPTSNWPPDSLPYSFCGVSRSGTLGSAAYRAKLSQYFSAVNAYISAAGYDDGAYYHIVNEPQTFTDYEIVGQISSMVASAAPDLRQMVSEQVEPAIYDYPGAKIDIWLPTITNYEPEKSQQRQEIHGEEVWWYYLYGDNPPLPNPILMSHPGTEARLTPWLAWAERVDGLLHYSATDWSPNPWTDPNVTGKDNGDGFFFYPPRKDGAPLSVCGVNGHRLVPSIRWENLRDGMEDYEYLWLLGGTPRAGSGNRADPFVEQLVESRTAFSHIPTELTAVREAVAQAILNPPQYNHGIYLPILQQR